MVHGLTADELYQAAQVYGEAMNRAVPLVSGLPAAWDRKPGPPPGPPEVTLPPSEPLDGPVRSLLDMSGKCSQRKGAFAKKLGNGHTKQAVTPLLNAYP